MSAVADQIGDAAAAAVGALGLAGLAVVRRKTASTAKGDEFPLAVVTVGEEGEVEHLTGGAAPWDRVTYPVTVVLVTGGGSVLGDDATLRAWRAAVRGVVNAPSTYAAAVDGFDEATAAGRWVFLPAGLGAALNYSVLSARVGVVEARVR